MKYKVGDVIKCPGNHFSMREITKTDEAHNKYVTKFLEDDSIVESDAKIIDSHYQLVKEKT